MKIGFDKKYVKIIEAAVKQANRILFNELGQFRGSNRESYPLAVVRLAERFDGAVHTEEEK